MESPQTTPRKQTLRILIIDDHELIIDAFKNAIFRYQPEVYDYDVSYAYNCKDAYHIITENKETAFDLAFLDIKMPVYEEKEIFSGEDLAVLLKNENPNCKVIILTMFSEVLKAKKLIQRVNPNGLVFKNDLDYDELLYAVDEILNGRSYYSKTIVQKLLKNKEETPDDFDKKILLYSKEDVINKIKSKYIPTATADAKRRKADLDVLLNMLNNQSKRHE